MFDRKKAKESSKKSLKKHYWIFVIACFISVFWGVDYTGIINFSQKLTDDYLNYKYITDSIDLDEMDLGNYSAWDVYSEIIVGNIDKANNIAEEIIKNNKSSSRKLLKKIELGHRDGVFANIANRVSSGSIFLTIFIGIRSIVGNDSAATIIFIIISILIFVFAWACLLNVYKAAFRRVFLEGYNYEKIHKKAFIHFFSIKRYFKAVLTMLVTFGFKVLWSLTIIGIFIKNFSYFLVPYIVAENPDISPLNAINLSREMMNGHKFECFKLKLSFIGWYILEFMTLGIVGIFYSNPYQESFFTEYYVYLRKLAKENKIKNSELLNDDYLYKKADKEIILEAYKDIEKLSQIPEPLVLPGNRVWRFFANVFGIVPTYSKTEQEYFDSNIRKTKISHYKKIINGEIFPSRLNPTAAKQKEKRFEFLNFQRHYSLCSLIIMFFIFSFIGWFWEVAFHLVEDGCYVNRGVLHGPWLPIYGSGCLLILILLNKLKSRPVWEFLASILLCGSVEYITAVILECKYHEKWWDYTGYFLNIDSKVCAEGLLVFGLGGMIVVYFVAPFLDNIFRKIKIKYLLPLCIVLISLFMIDTIHSFTTPNIGDGITKYEIVENINYEKNSNDKHLLQLYCKNDII